MVSLCLTPREMTVLGDAKEKLTKSPFLDFSVKGSWCQMWVFFSSTDLMKIVAYRMTKKVSIAQYSVMFSVHVSNLFPLTLKTIKGWIWAGSAHRAESRGAPCRCRTCCWAGLWTGRPGWGASGGGSGERRPPPTLHLPPLPQPCASHDLISPFSSMLPLGQITSCLPWLPRFKWPLCFWQWHFILFYVYKWKISRDLILRTREKCHVATGLVLKRGCLCSFLRCSHSS